MNRNSLSKIVKKEDLKATFQIILTDLEQAHLKKSPEWKLTDQILSKIETAENPEEWKTEISQSDFSYVNYLNVLCREVYALINLLFRKTSTGLYFNYENKEVKKSLVNFAEWLEQEEERAEKNERKEVK